MKVSYGKKMSISFSKAKKNETSLRHNNRDFTDKEKKSNHNKHINFSMTDKNKVLVKKDVRQAYEEIFGQALIEYNSKQKRDDRKIDDYYSKVFRDKKMSTQKEFLVQVGNKDDFEKDLNGELWQTANKILEDYCESFEERNPNFKIYNAVIHNDESCPHLHLNVIPIAEGYKRGLQKQPSFDKALRQQFGMEKEKSGSSFEVFGKFRDQEISFVEKSLEQNKISRLEVGTNSIENHHEYKKMKRELEEKEQELENLEDDFEELKDKFDELSEEVSVLEKTKETVSTEVWMLENNRDSLFEKTNSMKPENIIKYNVPGISKDKYAVISLESFEKLKEQNELVPVLVEKNKDLSSENKWLVSTNDYLLKENKQQEMQISRMQNMLIFARKRMEKIVDNGYEVWNRVVTYASKFYPEVAEDLPSDMLENDFGEKDFQNHQRNKQQFNRTQEMDW